MLKKYVDRVGHVHLKDMRLPVVEEARKNDWSFLQAVRNGAFTVPGDGDVDFDPVFRCWRMPATRAGCWWRRNRILPRPIRWSMP